MSVVITDHPRVGAETAQAFAEFDVAMVNEALGMNGLLSTDIRPIYPGARISGPAVTVSVPPGDNWMLYVALEQCWPGDILVVSPTGPSESAYVGELLALSLVQRGVLGVILDGGCRDVAALTGMRFPIWARAITAKGPVRRTLGRVNVPVECAGQTVHPGDLVVADDDGVVVVPRTKADEALPRARAQSDRESYAKQCISRGELGLDFMDMREALRAKGLTYHAWQDDAP